MPPQQDTMLCNACIDLLSVVKTHPPGNWTGTKPALFEHPEGPNEWAGSHHVGAGDFYDAVRQGCYICWTIYRDCSTELREQAHTFRTFYQLRALDADGSAPHLEDHYELEFTTEILNGDAPIAKQQVFDCSGVFKILPKNEVSASGEPLALTPNTFSGKCKDQVRQWLDNCRATHVRCNQDWRTGAGSPARLLHINPTTRNTFRLEKFAKRSRPPRYVTLSHCWGAGTAVTLTTANQQHLSAEWSPINSLPKRFQDAMQITIWMGVEYIWIDALCIIQDSRDDWLAESTKMGDIYTNSFCNIAATSADPQKGCFTERLVYMAEPYPLSDPQLHNREKTYVIGYDDFWSNSLTDTALHTRGWVLQERLLSPRTIHFGQEQIFWECRCEMACEAYPDGIPEQFHNRKMHAWRQADKILNPAYKRPSDASLISKYLPRLISTWLSPGSKTDEPYWVYEVWSRIVEVYMECKLSYAEDKLVAISGIAQKVTEATNERYLAGLWDNALLPQSLLWHVLGRRQADGTPSVRSASAGDEDYRAPSWSWASLEAKVIWNWPAKCDKVVMDILSTNVEQPKGSRLARVSSAQMKIRGSLFEACLQIASRDMDGNPEEDGLYTLVLDSQDYSNNLQQYSMEPTIYLDTPMMPESDSMDVFLLPICTQWQERSGVEATTLAGLLLRKVVSPTAGTRYERIGIFGLDYSQACAICGIRPDEARSIESISEGMRREDILLI
ncbi:uncharacterized protein Z519_08590 [Cladophialophora bantiana CBS 173.52]|uniref:Heterokaryon incompatibility domain-containing protein n=1 Tax=Cladophialophora bantiana (strain ATCC 10958 / CBS 173.52 / CDC B-1940 / NIH 8579) TaxID=1442370 RepID=A0A0D2FWA1_CLAB1|nr:uncharacterized protein Z519_08590 [Cladophialophora bantiana CBS 173.52]KIW90807.1 hypothetical protein Z519_08590 [Cladophialophora bantiana CBS 173.52]